MPRGPQSHRRQARRCVTPLLLQLVAFADGIDLAAGSRIGIRRANTQSKPPMYEVGCRHLTEEHQSPCGLFVSLYETQGDDGEAIWRAKTPSAFIHTCHRAPYTAPKPSAADAFLESIRVGGASSSQASDAKSRDAARSPTSASQPAPPPRPSVMKDHNSPLAAYLAAVQTNASSTSPRYPSPAPSISGVSSSFGYARDSSLAGSTACGSVVRANKAALSAATQYKPQGQTHIYEPLALARPRFRAPNGISQLRGAAWDAVLSRMLSSWNAEYAKYAPVLRDSGIDSFGALVQLVVVLRFAPTSAPHPLNEEDVLRRECDRFWDRLKRDGRVSLFHSMRIRKHLSEMLGPLEQPSAATSSTNLISTA